MDEFSTYDFQQRKANLHSLSIDAGPGANRASYSIGVKSILLLRVEQEGLKLTNKKQKQSHYRPGQALRVPEVKNPRFQNNRYMKVVRLSALSTGRLYPHKKFLVLIPVRV
jgi:hypothetical protein